MRGVCGLSKDFFLIKLVSSLPPHRRWQVIKRFLYCIYAVKWLCILLCVGEQADVSEDALWSEEKERMDFVVCISLCFVLNHV